MLSTIKIDTDHDHLPIIQIKAQQSSDVRDRLVEKFLQHIYTNCTSPGSPVQGLCIAAFILGPDRTTVNIRPLNYEDLSQTEISDIVSAAKSLVEMLTPNTSTTNS